MFMTDPLGHKYICVTFHSRPRRCTIENSEDICVFVVGFVILLLFWLGMIMKYSFRVLRH